MTLVRRQGEKHWPNVDAVACHGAWGDTVDSMDPQASVAPGEQRRHEEVLAYDTPQALLGFASALIIEGLVVTVIWYVRSLFT